MITANLIEKTVKWTSRQLQKRVAHFGTNHFLEGIYAPVQEEHSETD